MQELRTELKYLIRIFSLDPRHVIGRLASIQHGDLEKLIPEVEYELKFMGLNAINDEEVSSWTSYISRKYLVHPEDNEFKSPFFFPVRIADKFLKIMNERPICRTEMLGRWHGLTINLGEDLFTTALLAYRKYNENKEPAHFQWEKIIKSDFHSLNNMLESKKLSENHMHLKGSSPYFDLNWLSLMNYPKNRQKEFQTFSRKTSLMPVNIISFADRKQIDLYKLVQIAACLRIALYKLCCCNDIEIFKKEMNPHLKSILHDTNLLSCYFKDFLSEISVELMFSKYRQFDEKVDYAINFPVNYSKSSSALTGERRIYYSAYLYLLEKGEFYQQVQQYFYLYILIINIFSNEFIQKNERYGFQNFQDYQERKTAFIPAGSVYDKLMIKMAIVDNMDENNIDRLEVRFRGGTSQKNLYDAIKCIDKCCSYEHRIRADTEKIPDGELKHFFVLHFIKRPCEFCKINDLQEKELWILKCRDYLLRKEIKREAMAIVNLRQQNSSTAMRIYGIDAASSEIACRPEVFAQSFRYLRNHHVTSLMTRLGIPEDKPVPNLRVTFHVGEDFYDLLDGLRAIDEAIDFLQLGYGDRIGHGVALGLDIEDYYQKRNYEIALPRQNFLDNIAWMLNKIKLWDIDISTALYEKLSTEFRDNYKKVFYKAMIDSDLSDYIQAMALRDENPELFFAEYEQRENIRKSYTISHWAIYSSNRNKHFYKYLSKSIYELIQRYHYDTSVKSNGNIFTKYTLDKEYIKSLKILQLKMRQKIEAKGIAVESNPSSNYLIGNLRDMSKIPLFKLFPIDEQESGSNRLNVSVNTDDQGVFYTSLNKEYSMLAFVQQQKKNPDGSRRYSDDHILKWIERLIKNGNEQSFFAG